MMREYFKNTIAGIEAKLREEPARPNPRKKLALGIARMGERLYAHENHIAWCGVTIPFELLTAMGVTSYFIEFMGAMLASTGMAGTLLANAEEQGFAADTCGYHRAVMGAAISGALPRPAFLIGSTCPCAGGLATIENLARHFNKKLLVLNVPRDDSQTSVACLAGQLKEMVGFVAAHTGQKPDTELLYTTIKNTNSARRLIADVYKLAAHVPSPASSRDLSNFGIVMALLFGTKDAIEIAQAFHDEFTNRIANNTSGVAGERIRLLWIQNRIQFKNPVITLLEDQYKAAIVTDELNDITWDEINPDDPYPGLARRAISIPFNGCIERRITHLKKLANDYQIHGAINPCHFGCRQGTGARGLIEKGLKAIGVPVLNLEVDCIDERNFAWGQIKTRIEAFIEMVGG
ncbi:MAG: 2-hydroxyacyl-CoA dehydratase [Deltaproteobacteria bacterium]|nr:2-hydroxyacyl-CoA dehydratase [Deltaproteobacteria bacterium]